MAIYKHRVSRPPVVRGAACGGRETAAGRFLEAAPKRERKSRRQPGRYGIDTMLGPGRMFRSVEDGTPIDFVLQTTGATRGISTVADFEPLASARPRMASK